MTTYLKIYLDEIRRNYNSARVKYTELQDELKAANDLLQNSLRDTRLSAKGKDEARVKYSGEINRLKREIEQLIKDTQKSFADTRSRADAVFGDKYRATPDKLDANALELLKSGVLTDAEIKNMAQKYSENATMCRLISKYAQERADKNHDREMQLLAISLKRITPKHLEGIDALILCAENGLRLDRVAAESGAKIYDKFADRIFSEYGNISFES